MALGRKRVIGMELRAAGAKMVEMDLSGRAPGILKLGSIELRTEELEEASDKLGKFFEREGFRSRIINIALLLPSIDHEFLSLPPMSRGELRTVVQREVRKKTVERGRRLRYDYQIIGRVEEEGIQKIQVMLVLILEDEIIKLVTLLQRYGIKPQTITTLPMALANLLRLTGGWEKGEVVGWAHLEEEKGFVAIYKDGALKLSREFPLPSAPAMEKESHREGAEEADIDLKRPEEEVLERTATELNRSALYFKQHYRGEMVDRFVISGRYQNLQSRQEELRAAIPMPIEFFSMIEGLELRVPAAEQEDARAALPLYAAAIGAAWDLPERGLINLVPLEIVERRKRFFTRTLIVGSAAVFLLAAGLGYYRLHQSVSSFRSILDAREDALARLEPLKRQIEQVQQIREHFRSRLTYLRAARMQGFLWYGFLKELSLIVPQQMVFEAMRVRSVDGTMKLEIQGRVSSETALAGQSLFNQFYERLNNSPFLKGLDRPIIGVKRQKMEASPTGASQHETKGLKDEWPLRHKESIVEFTIRGILRKGEDFVRP